MKNEKLIVHIILNSHLDPVWLWNLDQGIDAVIATARTACDLLDDYPEIHMTRGEAWFYETVEKYDPATFRRLAAHIAGGRLHVVGGWYIQPDCNLASPESYRKHGVIGGKYFREKFGIRQVATGYNVDSFGHGAFLVDFYRAAGMSNYCFMRPSTQEKTLPGDIFRWRSPSGAELLASRIFESYSSSPEYLPGHLERVAASADRKIGHVMCFCGVGDHGGGPARAEIDWLLEHRNDFEDLEIRFSHPDAFFDCVRASGAELPVVEGELQHHAIGCYTACSRIKREIRLTENRLIQAEKFLKPAEAERAWKSLLFATFHDLLPGSAIASGYDRIYDSLGEARKIAADAVSLHLRRKNLRFRPKPLQRLILDNTGTQTFKGLAEFEPWVARCWRKPGTEELQLTDETGRIVPFQLLTQEAAVIRLAHPAVPVEIPAGGRKIFYLNYCRKGESCQNCKEPFPALVEGALPDSFRCGNKEYFGAPLRFDVLKDSTDTWSHAVNGYAAKADYSFRKTGEFEAFCSGPLVAESLGRYSDRRGNSIKAMIRTEHGLRVFRLRLKLNFLGGQQIIKMVITPGFPVTERLDGVPGGVIRRGLNGEEFPLFNRIQLKGENRSLAVISKDCFGCDVQPDGTLRLTLLRTPYFAHHDPYKVPKRNFYRITDQGTHEYEFTFLADPSEEEIQNEVFRQTDPVVFSETTLGVRII